MMNKRKRRIFTVLSIVFGGALAVSIALFALRQNIDLYYTPSQILQPQNRTQPRVRLGGMVVKNSVRHVANSLKVHFALTDFHHQVSVYYEGILPALFREGQGIVAEGRLNDKGIFVATRVLAKHDENYKPPEMDGNKS